MSSTFPDDSVTGAITADGDDAASTVVGAAIALDAVGAVVDAAGAVAADEVDVDAVVETSPDAFAESAANVATTEPFTIEKAQDKIVAW
ncbi:MAG TPA: hypothetical protein V6C76_03720 [Drouetiella sp.]